MTIADVAIKLVVAFIIISVYMRISSNSQLAPLTASDQVGNIVLGALAGGTLTPDVSVWILVLSMVLWCALQLLVRWAKFKSSRLTALIDGKRIQLVANGKLLCDGFQETKLLPEDFILSLHEQDILSLSQVWNAWYETDGSIIVDKKDERMHSKALVSNGTIIDNALASIGKDEAWLLDSLQQKGCEDIKDVFLAEWHDEQLWVYAPQQEK